MDCILSRIFFTFPTYFYSILSDGNVKLSHDKATFKGECKEFSKTWITLVFDKKLCEKVFA